MQRTPVFKRFAGYGLLGGAALGAMVCVLIAAFYALPWNNAPLDRDVGIGPSGYDSVVLGLMLSPIAAVQGAAIGLMTGVLLWTAVALFQHAKVGLVGLLR